MTSSIELKIAFKALFAMALFVVWHFSQKFIAKIKHSQFKKTKSEAISDRVHQILNPLHRKLLNNRRFANSLLIASSLVIDLLAITLMLAGIFGPSMKPLVSIALLFFIRQVCQLTTGLPSPSQIIWRNPGFPSLFVTYDVADDFFFSGHTALAILGGLFLANTFANPWGLLLAFLIILFEIFTVLALRAHWTLDVITALFVALWVNHISPQLIDYFQ